MCRRAWSSRFDFRRDPRMRTDPWGLIRELSGKPDIFYTPDLGGYWVVNRNDLVEETFRRHDLFSNQYVTIPKIPGAPPLIPNNIDPPGHAPYRKFRRAEDVLAACAELAGGGCAPAGTGMGRPDSLRWPLRFRPQFRPADAGRSVP